MGHIDIFANDGIFQPGCSNTTSLTPFWQMPLSQFNALVCSHGRAVELFRDSLISSCKAVAYECADYNTFKQVIMSKSWLIIPFPSFLMVFNCQCIFNFLHRETVILVARPILVAFQLECKRTCILAKQEQMLSFITPHQALLLFVVS